MRITQQGFNSITAPATVSDEFFLYATGFTGKARKAIKDITSQETCQLIILALLITREVLIMISITKIKSISISSSLIAGSLALFIGLSLIYGTGIVQNIAVHNGAHDMRHALGFPCH